MSVSAAAREFNVPRKTLSDKINIKHLLPPGRRTALNAEEEAALVNYINFMAARAFPLTIPLIKSFAWAIAKRSGEEERFNIDDGPGKTWWQKFRKRHDVNITVRKAN